jgi:long-chain fatty acid transport protein
VAGGIEFPDIGSVALGRGAAFAARADDLTAIHYNPAGLAKTRSHFALTYSHNFSLLGADFDRSAWDFDSNGWHDFAASGIANPVSNGGGWYWKGAFLAVASDLGTTDFTLAFGVYGPSAVGSSSFPVDGSQRYMLVDRDVMVIYYTLAAAYRITDDLSVGLSLQWVDMPFCRFSLVVDGYNDNHYRPFKSDQDLLAGIDVADRFNVTAIVGVWWRPHPSWEIGLSGRVIPVWIDAGGTLTLDPIGSLVAPDPKYTDPSSPDYVEGYRNYSLLACPPGADLSQCRPGADGATLRFVLPPVVRLGGRYVHRDGDREAFDVELDLVYEAWSMLDAFDVTLDADRVTLRLRDGSTPTRPIRSMSIPKDWSDTFSVRLGSDVAVVPGWLTLRAGASYEYGANSHGYTNLDYVPFHRVGLGAGFTFRYKGLSLSAAYAHVFQPDVTVSAADARLLQQRPSELCATDPTFCDPDYGGLPAPPVNAGTYSTRIDVISVGLTIDFMGFE